MGSYVASLRVALFLGDDEKARSRVREIIKGVFRIRNKAVHEGTASSTIDVLGEPENPSAVVSEGAKLTAELIRRLLSRGSFPNWQDLELHKHS